MQYLLKGNYEIMFKIYAAIISVSFIVVSDSAFAGITAPAAPGPIAGAGIPALMAFAAGYRALKNRRSK